MTDQENLRDRIEAVLDGFTGESWEDHHRDAAQAVIDEFGLTIEPHCEDCDHKVIDGTWEENNDG